MKENIRYFKLLNNSIWKNWEVGKIYSEYDYDGSIVHYNVLYAALDSPYKDHWKEIKTIKFSIHGPMTSGQGEQAVRKYKKIIGKRGNWYVAFQENEADNIYFASKSKEYSDGFAGATLSFELEDGTIDKIQGPWHSNSDGLFDDTGYDVRNKHLTKGIIAKNKTHGEWHHPDEYSDVLHYDEVPVIGEYDRIENLAQMFANELNCKVYFAVKTGGGGSSHYKEPKKE